MKNSKASLITAFGLALSFCINTNAVRASAKAGNEPSSIPALQSALTSEDEFKDDLQKSGVPFHWWIHSTSAISGALNASETVTYYDEPSLIENNLNTNGYNRIQRRDADAHPLFSVKQLELQETLLFQNGQDIHASCDPSADLYCKEGHDYLNRFKTSGFLDPTAQKDLSSSLVKTAFSDFVSGSISSDSFTKTALKYPKAFPLLPVFLSQARALQNQPVTDTIKGIISSALLLTLDAIVPTADSRNDTYPYFDKLVPTGSLLPVDLLFQKLSATNQWPQTVDISPNDRKKLGGVYADRASSDRWTVKGFYDEGSNEVRLDLQNDFYENVYAYYHELWHVAWSRSALNREQVERISTLLKQSDSDENRQALRDSILSGISENEFRAIDQQIRLFHALGIQTDDWGGRPAVSALRWHDSYVGQDTYKLLIKKNQRGGDYFWKHLNDRDMAVIGLPAVVGEIGIASFNRLRGDHIRNSFNQEFGSYYWKSQTAAHSRFFEDRYFGQVLNVTSGLTPIDTKRFVDSLGEIYVPQYSCSDVSRIRAALGDSWKFGFPFTHTVTDPQNCPGEAQNAKHPGTDGSHTDIDAFPSLEGPEAP